MKANRVTIILLFILVMYSIFFNISLLNKSNNDIEIRNKLIDYLANKLEFSYHMFESEGVFELYQH